MKLFEPTGLIVILIVVLVIFGPAQLPKLAKTIGQSSKTLRDSMEGKDEESAEPKAAAAKTDAGAAEE
jgi:sec-independent protein translocase protein TatA